MYFHEVYLFLLQFPSYLMLYGFVIFSSGIQPVHQYRQPAAQGTFLIFQQVYVEFTGCAVRFL